MSAKMCATMSIRQLFMIVFSKKDQWHGHYDPQISVPGFFAVRILEIFVIHDARIIKHSSIVEAAASVGYRADHIMNCAIDILCFSFDHIVVAMFRLNSGHDVLCNTFSPCSNKQAR